MRDEIEGQAKVEDRNTWASVPEIVMDLSRTTSAIQADLRERFPKVIDLHWEIETDEQSGHVWSSARALARLRHCGPRGR